MRSKNTSRLGSSGSRRTSAKHAERFEILLTAGQLDHRASVRGRVRFPRSRAPPVVSAKTMRKGVSLTCRAQRLRPRAARASRASSLQTGRTPHERAGPGAHRLCKQGGHRTKERVLQGRTPFRAACRLIPQTMRRLRPDPLAVFPDCIKRCARGEITCSALVTPLTADEFTPSDRVGPWSAGGPEENRSLPEKDRAGPAVQPDLPHQIDNRLAQWLPGQFGWLASLWHWLSCGPNFGGWCSAPKAGPVPSARAPTATSATTSFRIYFPFSLFQARRPGLAASGRRETPCHQPPALPSSRARSFVFPRSRPRLHGHGWLFLPKRCARCTRSRLARIVSAIRDHRPRGVSGLGGYRESPEALRAGPRAPSLTA
jgi:hypothetical protein